MRLAGELWFLQQVESEDQSRLPSVSDEDPHHDFEDWHSDAVSIPDLIPASIPEEYDSCPWNWSR